MKTAHTVNVLKFQTLFCFCSQIKIWLSGLNVRIANREDPDQTASVLQKQSDLGLPYLSWPFVFEVLEHFFLQTLCVNSFSY